MGATLVIKAATTTRIRIDIDLDTDQGPIKGHFFGRGIIRDKDGLQALADELGELAEQAEDGDTKSNTSEVLLRRMYQGFDGLGNASGPLEGEEAWAEVLNGPLGVYLSNAAVAAYWAHFGNGARQGNSRPRRGR